MNRSTFASQWNSNLIEDYYRQWQEGKGLDPKWNAFFQGFEVAQNGNYSEPSDNRSVDSSKQARVIGAIYAYRSIGHTQAQLNPLEDEVEKNPRLKLDRLGFEEKELNDVYHTGNYLNGKQMSIRQLLEDLETTYCGSLGIEYLHIQETPQRRWLQREIEPILNQPNFKQKAQQRILEKILEAEAFEDFLHKTFVGQKRFSLEGAETLIPALDAILELCPQLIVNDDKSDAVQSLPIEEIVIGMPHRGRLNVLSCILGKSNQFIFQEFSPNYIREGVYGDGDVKYHLGYDSKVTTSGGKEIKVSLVPNPSHLESVDPVVQGYSRAVHRRDHWGKDRRSVLPLLIHGDAAIAGQGVVSEVLNLSQLNGYKTGGTLHFVVNNQIGFTTDPADARSSRYCTDIAKMIEAPIFHVNGDDPLAVVWATQLAVRFRQNFGKDVFIDMYCYRRRGHNESDEPSFTQPRLYKKIKDHPLISKTLGESMISAGSISKQEVDQTQDHYRKEFKEALDELKHREKSEITDPQKSKAVQASTGFSFQGSYDFSPLPTPVAFEQLAKVAEVLTDPPKNFNLNPKIHRQLKEKKEAFENDSGIDWGFAEQLAWGTVLLEGNHVRLSGQDSIRGTFSQRHAIFYDVDNYNAYIPLQKLAEEEEAFRVYNSSLSEAAVMGFEYGYSLGCPEVLCMWEAQFGDFANGAQVIIDQYLTSSESKWSRTSGLVLLLPHGYEGQGPEHSSARLERFLQACAEDNIQVCNLTTPAQYFHALRRQVKGNQRRPLIIMTPKSLLRAKEAVSYLNDFTQEHFKPIIDDHSLEAPAQRLVFCSGKVYYGLLAEREVQGIKDTALIRIERLYPLDRKTLQGILDNHKGYNEVVWCQEEPKNMGAWGYIAPILKELTGIEPRYAGRKPSASPAPGSLARHKRSEIDLLEDAFALKGTLK